MRRWVMAVLAFLFGIAFAVAPAPLRPFHDAPAAAASSLPGGRFVPVPSTTLAAGISVPAGGTFDIQVGGQGPVPGNAAAVSVNLNAAGTDGGSLTVYPAGTPRPATVNLTYRPGETARGAVTTALAPDGRITVANSGSAAVTAGLDLQGYVVNDLPTGGSVYVPITPYNLVNNRSVAAGAQYTFSPFGLRSVPTAESTAVVLGVLASGGAAGRATLFPAGETKPATPHVEYVVGDYGSNQVIVRRGATSQVVFANEGTAATNIWVYVAGYYVTTQAATPGSTLMPVPPQRLDNEVTLAGGATRTVTVTGRAGVPTEAVSGACLQVTVTGPASGNESLAIYPASSSTPSIYTIRYQAAATSTGATLTGLTAGQVMIRNRGTSAVTISVDLTCYFRAPTRPRPPTEVTATPADRTASVSWRAPDDGGATITEYLVTSMPDGHTATAPPNATGAVVSGLTNGVTYRFVVVAKNAVGSSDASAMSNAVKPTPPAVPGTPFVTSVYPRDEAVRVSWSPPDTGGVTGYQVTATPGGASAQAGADATEAVVTGLTNGTTYTFTVRAVNANGAGSLSVPSEPVVPSPADPPLEPAGLLVVPLDQRIDVQWVAPADGGAPITGYRVTAEPGGHAVDVAADTTVAALTGLTNGTAYTVRVTARNKAGTGPQAERGDLVPAAARPPAAPTDVRAGVAGNGVVSLRWNAPVDVGTSAVTGYTVTAEPGGVTVSTVGTTATVPGLDPALGYRFTVTARNAAGAGPASASTAEVTPALAVKAAPKVLDAGEMGTLRVVRVDGSLVFEQPPGSISGLTAGTVVILPVHDLTPNGAFRRVTGVETTAGLVIVRTAPAALTEVFDAAALAAVSEIGDRDIEEFVADSPAIRRKEPTLRGRTLSQGAHGVKAPGVDIGLRGGHVIAEITMTINHEQVDNPLRPASKVPPLGGRLEAQLDLNPRVENSIDIGAGGVDTYHQVSVEYVAQFRAKFGVLKEAEATLPGARIKARCFNIQAGPVPVILCLEFEVKPTLRVDGSVGVTAAVTVGRVIGAEMTTHNGLVTSHRGINQSTGRDFSELEAYADGSITLALPFESTLYFYNYAGPGLIIRPYLQFKFDTTQNPWWELRAGITLGIFFKTREFFGFQIEFTKDDVVNFFITLLDAGGPFAGLVVTPDEAETDPGGTVQFSAAPAGYPSGIPIHWRMVSGPGSIDATGTYHADQLAGRAVVEAYSPAESGRKELVQRATVHVRGTTVASAPLNATAKPKTLGAEVSWAPPVTDGNLPIDKYAVVSTPPSRTTYVPGSTTTVKVEVLTPGVAYTFRVYALNAEGSSVPSAPTNPVTPYETITPTGPVVNIAVDAGGNPDSSRQAGYSGVFVSGNGRYVFFETKDRSNLAPPDIYNPTGWTSYLVRKDRFTGEIVVVSRGLDGITPIPSTTLGYGINNRSYHSVAVSYDGNRVVYTGDVDPAEDGNRRLLLHDIAAQRTTNLTSGLDYLARHVVLSKDGNTVAFVGHPFGAQSPRRIYLIREGQAPRRADTCFFSGGGETCTGTGAFTSIDLTADGRVLYYTDRFPTNGFEHLLRVELGTGAVTDLNTQTGTRVTTGGLTPEVAGDDSLVASNSSHYDSVTRIEVEGLAVKRPTSGLPLTPADIVVPDGAYVLPYRVSEDGRAVLYLSYRSGLDGAYLYDVESASVVTLFAPGNTTVWQLDMAEDASIAAWTRCEVPYSVGNCTYTGAVWVQALH